MKKKSTNNYERPEVQVVYVETEAGFASNGNNPQGLQDFTDADIINESGEWI